MKKSKDILEEIDSKFPKYLHFYINKNEVLSCSMRYHSLMRGDNSTCKFIINCSNKPIVYVCFAIGNDGKVRLLNFSNNYGRLYKQVMNMSDLDISRGIISNFEIVKYGFAEESNYEI